MINAIKHESSFIGYEYLEVAVSHEMENVYMDGYQNFGWEYEGRGIQVKPPVSLTLKFKRDRALRSKVELTRLQRQFDACAGSIVAMEKSKTLGASVIAFSIGMVGAAFTAGSIMAAMAGLALATVLLAVPAVIGWGAPYLVYSMIKRKKTAEVTPFIDGKYDEIYAACEKANGLLSK